MTATEPDFEGLIRECFARPGDHDALTRFDAAFRPHLLTALKAISGREPSLAEDAYQAAFIKFIDIFQTAPQSEINYTAYFVAIAKNKLVDELRRRRRHVHIDDLFDELGQPPQSDPGQQLETRIAILQAMQRLDERCRFVLESYYIAESPAPEIARRLSLKPGSIYKLLERCRARLREILRGGCQI